jgi:tRNA-dihydrouridine synthase A
MFEFYLAPMMEVTTPSFRKMMRIVSPCAVLFTEMIVADAVVNMARARLAERLGFYEAKTVVQIGGANPGVVAEAVALIMDAFGFRDFNLNCGCPSARVKKGCFGAVLMLTPGVVADIVNAVERRCGVVLSVKMRLGVDDHDSYEFVHGFVKSIVENTSCDTFFVHARKCLLSGLSPKQNYTKPCLNYEFVHRLKADFPAKKFVLNGGIVGTEQLSERRGLDGFMIGREAVKNVFIFNEMMAVLDGGDAGSAPRGDLERAKALIKEYAALYGESDVIKNHHVSPLRNLLSGVRNGRKYRQQLSAVVAEKCVFKDLFEKISVYF